MEDAAIQIAETIQTASIKRSPSPRHDINPSTAASSKEPVKVVRANSDAIDSDETPEYDIRPVRRRATLPPLPDLRFEQSYLKSIEGKDTQGIIWITFRDQLVMPLLQGTLWTLALAGWRHWNKGAEFSGRTIGSKIRVWWYGVNNWKIPERRSEDHKLAREIQEVRRSLTGRGGARTWNLS